jgi:hypothetical protein
MVFSGSEQFIITCGLLYLFYVFIAPFLAIIFFGVLFLIVMSGYTIYVFFIRAPFRALFLWKEGKIKSSFTRSKELWYQTHTWKQWFIACFKSDIETLKFIINF